MQGNHSLDLSPSISFFSGYSKDTVYIALDELSLPLRERRANVYAHMNTKIPWTISINERQREHVQLL